MYSKITNQPTKIYTDITHDSISFLDDNTNIVGCYDIDILSSYLTDFHYLLSSFYFSNKLKINHDKTQMLISCKNKFGNATKNFTFNAGEFFINQSDYTTILGYKISNNLTSERLINFTTSSCYFKLKCIRQIANVINFKTRLQLANSVIIGFTNYSLPFFKC